jgi:hypothetical protein
MDGHGWTWPCMGRQAHSIVPWCGTCCALCVGLVPGVCCVVVGAVGRVVFRINASIHSLLLHLHFGHCGTPRAVGCVVRVLLSP